MAGAVGGLGLGRFGGRGMEQQRAQEEQEEEEKVEEACLAFAGRLVVEDRSRSGHH